MSDPLSIILSSIPLLAALYETTEKHANNYSNLQDDLGMFEARLMMEEWHLRRTLSSVGLKGELTLPIVIDFFENNFPQISASLRYFAVHIDRVLTTMKENLEKCEQDRKNADNEFSGNVRWKWRKIRQSFTKKQRDDAIADLRQCNDELIQYFNLHNIHVSAATESMPEALDLIQADSGLLRRMGDLNATSNEMPSPPMSPSLSPSRDAVLGFGKAVSSSTAVSTNAFSYQTLVHAAAMWKRLNDDRRFFLSSNNESGSGTGSSTNAMLLLPPPYDEPSPSMDSSGPKTSSDTVESVSELPVTPTTPLKLSSPSLRERFHRLSHSRSLSRHKKSPEPDTIPGNEGAETEAETQDKAEKPQTEAEMPDETVEAPDSEKKPKKSKKAQENMPALVKLIRKDIVGVSAAK